MPITEIRKDLEALTMTVVADFPVPVERLWDAYADPRQLERFWGPPTYPATFTRHDLFQGGRSDYAMTGPEGDVSRGYWEFLAVQPRESFEVIDGFAKEDGSPNHEMPSMRMVFTFTPTNQGSQVTTTTYFSSLTELEQLLDMGMEQGMQEAMGQMDDVLADLSSFAAAKDCTQQLLSDTQVRIARVIRGSVEQVWRAHQDPDLMKQWMLGPDGWTMPICQTADEVGDIYRYEWEQAGGDGHFGFTGGLLEAHPPNRAVTTERMIGTDSPVTVNELTLTPVSDGTLLTLVVTYPDPQVRDTILETGMTDGMEASYQRMESQVLRVA